MSLKLLGSERRINTYLPSEQDAPAIAALSDGTYVAVWQSNGQDGSGWGVYAQRLDADGNPLGSETRVNTGTGSNQTEISVATVGNRYVVVWRTDSGEDGSGTSVRAQMFNNDGTAFGSEFRVNTTTSSNQYQPVVVGSASGFVVAWYDDGINGGDVRFQRFNASGVAQGSETQASVATAGQQSGPTATMASDGSFIIGWSDATTSDTQFRRFNANGTANGGDQAPATILTGSQTASDIAALSGGGFVVVYSDTNGRDGSGSGAYARIYNAVGTATADIRISAIVTGEQVQAKITALPDGGFAVVYRSDYDPANGFVRDIYLRSFDADGTARGADLNITNSGFSEYLPDLAVGADGAIAVLWDADGRDPAFPETNSGATGGIYLRMVGDPALVAVPQKLTIAGLDRSITIGENAANAGLQILQVNLSVTDPANVGYAGGEIRVQTGSGWTSADRLGVISTGNAADQIGVSGTTVSYGGVAIGTITANGQNGADLAISLNANVTQQAIDELLLAIGYGTTSSSPAATRDVAFRITNSAGASTEAEAFRINVTAEADGFQPIEAAVRDNSQTESEQRASQIAKLADGGFVVIWNSYGQDAPNSWGVFGQRYTAAGVATGPEFQVDTYDLGNEVEPMVAGLAGGGWVVVWTQQDGSVAPIGDGSSYSIKSQRYNANGTTAGAETIVNSVTSSTQQIPRVAALPAGGYVVTWQSYQIDTSGYGVAYRRFNADGTPIDAADFVANTQVAGDQSVPPVATFADGGFVITWVSGGQDGSGDGIYAQRFNAAGAKVGGEFLVNQTTTSSQTNPDVAVLSDGSIVFTWWDQSGLPEGVSSFAVMARRYTVSGTNTTATGNEFVVNETPEQNQQYPRIAALSNGNYVVTWYQTTGDVYYREFTAAGVAIDAQAIIDTTSGTQNYETVTALNNGAYVVGYTQSDGNSTGVFHRIIGNPADFVRQANPVIVDLATLISFQENAVNAGPQLLDASSAVTDADSANFQGGRLTLSIIENGSLQDSFGVRNEGNGVNQIGVSGTTVSYGGVAIGTISANGQAGANLIVDFNGAATPVAVSRLLQALTYANSSNAPNTDRVVSLIVSDGDGGQSAPQVFTVRVNAEQDGLQPIEAGVRDNSYTDGEQRASNIAKLADGGFVVIWNSYNQDSVNTWGVYGQRYTAAGVATGPEFQVNTYTGAGQIDPVVVGLAGGGWVVAWNQQDVSAAPVGDGSSSSIKVQRYNADGTRAGVETIPNSVVASEQRVPRLAALPAGGYIVTFDSYNIDTNNYGVAYRRFNADGTPIDPADVVVNTQVAGDQSISDVAVFGDGGFVVTWHSSDEDGSGYGIYAQRFSAAGAKVGSQFLVNQTTTGSQVNPGVAVLTDGSIVFTWFDQSGIPEGNGTQAVVARRFTVSGTNTTAAGDEFVVNETPENYQQYPRITALSNGHYAIAWYQTTGDVFYREFAANGDPVDGQVSIDATSGTQNYETITALNNGAYVVGYTQADGNSTGVYHRIIGNPANFLRQANPAIVDVASVISFGENAVNAGPQLLDASSAVTDSDSVNFQGGRLTLAILKNGSAQDSFGIRNEGNGANQIGVSGNTVSLGGVAIGTISSNGQAGANLVVDLAAAATPAAVSRLLQTLTYANSSNSPIADRVVSLIVSDGDGGQSAPQVFTVHVDAEAEAGSLHQVLAPERASTWTDNGPTNITSAALGDGGYVTVWAETNGQDTSSWGIYGQRFRADGTAVGAEFQINTNVNTQQADPQVTALANGGWVVAWTTLDGAAAPVGDGSSYSVKAQRYNADGTRAGVETTLNTFTTNDQRYPQLASLPVNATYPTGGFVGVWHSNGLDGNSYGIALRRFAADGTPIDAADQTVNTTVTGSQDTPDVAVAADGSFVVVWVSPDNSGSGIFAQRYSAAGAKVGGEFQVSTNIAGGQYAPFVTYLSNGSFVVVWHDNAGDSSGEAAKARIYSAAGIAQGGEFLVNQQESSSQYPDSLVSLADGGFAVAFYDAGRGREVYRQFDAAGVAQSDDVVLNDIAINTTTSTGALVRLNNGNVVASYRGRADGITASSDDDTDAVLQQILGTGSAIVRTAPPRLGDLGSPISDPVATLLLANVQGAAGAVVDGNVSVDFAGTLNGGALLVSHLRPATATDVLTLNNPRVAVAAGTVSVDGVAVGTISATEDGTGGKGLRIVFNNAATALRVREVVEAVSFSNSAATAGLARSLGFRLYDAAGNTQAPARDVDLSIAAAVTPAIISLTEVRTSATIAEQTLDAGPAQIDGSVAFTYTGGGLNTGKLRVSYQTPTAGNVRATEAITVADVGGITRSGNAVSYNATQIGTVTSSGLAGTLFEITFNANATQDAVDALIEAVSLSDTSNAPMDSRTLTVSVLDGASNTATVSGIVVNVTQQLDGLAFLGAERRLNSYHPDTQDVPRSIALSNGTTITIWRSESGQDSSGYGIFGQILAADGTPLGSEIRINSTTSGTQNEPAIAALTGGGFVAVWGSPDASGQGIRARIFDNAGNAVGNDFLVNTTAPYADYSQRAPTVAGLSDGGFVIGWEDSDGGGHDGSGNAVIAKRYNAAGGVVQAEFIVNQTTTSYQNAPSVVANATGFTFVWQSNHSFTGSSGYEVFARTFNASGAPVAGEFLVNTSLTGDEFNPKVARLANGDLVAAWFDPSGQILFQRFSAAGALLGTETAVIPNDIHIYTTDAYEFDIAAVGTGFAIAYNGVTEADNQYRVLVQQYDAAGAKVDGPVGISPAGSIGAVSQYNFHPTLAAVGGNLQVSWQGYRQNPNDTGFTYEIVTRQLRASAAAAAQDPVLGDVLPSVTVLESAANAAGGVVIDSNVSLSDADSANFNGGQVQLGVISAYGDDVSFTATIAQDVLGVRNEGTAADQIGVSGSTVTYAGTAIGTIDAVQNGQAGKPLKITLNASASVQAVERLIENLTYGNAASDPQPGRTLGLRVTDGSGGVSAAQNIVVNVTPEADGASRYGPLERVNAYRADTQETPAAARLTGGGYVLTWDSNNQDGSGSGVFAQVMGADGRPVGVEFRVNANMAGEQVNPAAVGLSDGTFVVAWRDASTDRIVAQRFTAQGGKIGGETVLDDASSGVNNVALTAQASGRYFASWNASGQLVGRVFNADGSGFTGEFQINGGGTETSSVAQLGNGHTVVVWQEYDGGYVIKGRLFNGSTADGAEFTISDLSGNYRDNARVAALAGGGFAVTWRDDSLPGGSQDVLVRRYDNTGTALGAAVRVNPALGGSQYSADIVALDNGGFAVAYYDSNLGSTSYAIQQFDAAGARVDNVLLADVDPNVYNNSAQRPALVALGGADFAVAFQSYYSGLADQETSYNIFQQVFKAGAPTPRSANPVLADVSASITVLENAANAAGGVLLDGNVSLSDSDSVNFNGGQVLANVLSGYAEGAAFGDTSLQDILGVRNLGTGADQIGVSGSTVTYAGAAIGTIDAVQNGQAGKPLVITLNASATVQAVERLVENLTYRNSASDAQAARTVGIRVTDGQGGASATQNIVVNITPEVDGADRYGPTELVNSYRPGSQDFPATARLTGGGYVVTWQSNNQDAWGNGVYAQVMAADGTPIGLEFQVNANAIGEQVNPAAVGLSDGTFVVAWRDASTDRIVAQRFTAQGGKLGGETVLDDASSGVNNVALTAQASGRYFASWNASGQLVGRVFNADGSGFTGEFQINGGGTDAPSVAQLGNGHTAVVWQEYDGGYVIRGRLFNGSTADGAEFTISDLSGNYRDNARVAALAGGGFAVTWRDDSLPGGSQDVLVRRYDNTGTALGAAVRVNPALGGSQYSADIVALDNGGFAVAYYDSNLGSTSYAIQQFDAAGARVDNVLLADVDPNVYNNSAQRPALVALGGADFAVAFQSYYSGLADQESSYNIFQQVFKAGAPTPRSANPVLAGLSATVTLTETAVNAAPVLIDSALLFSDSDTAAFAGGTFSVNRLTGYDNSTSHEFADEKTQDNLAILNAGTGAGQIGVSGANVSFGGTLIGTIGAGVDGQQGRPLVVTLNANATVAAVRALAESVTYYNSSNDPSPSRTLGIRITDGQGGVSAAQTIALQITPQIDGAIKYFGEFVANSAKPGTQDQPEIARLTNGTMVVAFRDTNGNDGSGTGVYFRRIDADGNPLGSDVLVNDAINGSQSQPEVVGLTDGGFLVTFTTDAGGSNDVRAQKYDAAGNQVGAEFLVHTANGSSQTDSHVVALANGGYAITWRSDAGEDGSGATILAKVFNGDGTAAGGQFVIDQFGTSTQYSPSVVQLDNGNLAFTWASYASGDGYPNVATRVFTAAGVAVGNELTVNFDTALSQEQPQIVAVAGGYFVIYADSNGNDSSGWGVFGQRFTNAGAKLGDPIRINSTTTSTQDVPTVTGTANGGFAVAFQYNGRILVQQFDAAGSRLDGEIVVDGEIGDGLSHSDYSPTIASVAGGGFWVAYQSYRYGEASPTYDIAVQRFASTLPQLTGGSVSGNEDTDILLPATFFQANFTDPQGDPLTAIRITQLPTDGTLLYDGVAVTPNQEIAAGAIGTNRLRFRPNANFNGVVQFGWNGSDGTSFAPSAVFATVTINPVNDAPGLSVGGAGSGTESFGNGFSRVLTFTDPDNDTIAVQVDWGDGTTSNYAENNNQAAIGHRYLDNGNYTVSITANDGAGAGNSIETGSFQVAIANVAPTLDLFGSGTVPRGQTFTLNLGGVVDPGADTVQTIVVNWGDGTTQTLNRAATSPFFPSTLTKVYNTVGQYTVTATLTDEDGTFADSDNHVVNVQGITANVSVGGDVNEGPTSQIQISVSNFGIPQGVTVQQLKAIWSDGTTQVINTPNVANTQTFTRTFPDGALNLTVQVVANDGVSDTALVTPQTRNVYNVAPTATLAAPTTTEQNQAFALTVSNKVDPGQDTLTSLRIRWNDGTQDTIVNNVNNLASAINISKSISGAPGNYFVQVFGTDEDGEFLLGTRSIQVTPGQITGQVSGASSVNEGSGYTVAVSNLQLPQGVTLTSLTAEWPDGVIQTINAPNPNQTQTFTRTVPDGTLTNQQVIVRTFDGTTTRVLGTQVFTVFDVAPTITADGAASIQEGQPYQLTLSNLIDPGADTITAARIEWGDGTTTTLNNFNFASPQVFSHNFSAPGSDVVRVFGTNEDGTFQLAARSIQVTPIDPTASVVAPASVNEGFAFNLAINNFLIPAGDTVSQISVDWGDGTAPFVIVNPPSGSFAPQHTYADGSASRTITVTATSDDGPVVLGTQTVSVANVAPVATLVSPGSVTQGTSFGITVQNKLDPGADTLTSLRIVWGDGTADTVVNNVANLAAAVNASHAYAAAGQRTIQVYGTDEDGEFLLDQKAIVVGSGTIQGTVTGNDASAEGSAYTLNVSALTVPQGVTVSQMTVDWGDGTTSVVNNPNVAVASQFTKTYADGNANRAISVTVIANGAPQVVGGKALSVTNVAPSATVAGNASVAEGAAYQLTVSNKVDPGADALTSLRIVWGDGTADTVVNNVANLAAAINASHVYADGNASRTIQVFGTDEDGEFLLGTKAVSVTNVAPSATVAGNASVAEGAAYQLTVSNKVDPGADALTSLRISWGDGTADTVVNNTADLAAAINASHVYADGNASRTIQVFGTDEDGEFLLGTKAVSVTNVAPSATVAGNASVAEGAAYQLTVSNKVDPGTDTLTSLRIVWGDGTADTVVNNVADLAAAVNASHVYADGNASRTIQVFGTDEDGEFLLGTKAVSVTNVAPSATVAGNASVAEGAAYQLTVSNKVDPGADTLTSLRIVWGDGTADTVVNNVADLATAINTSHIYADGNASRTIQVFGTDEDGEFLLGTKAVSVTNVAPVATLVSPGSVTQGTSFGITVQNKLDPGVDTLTSLRIVWGDGTADTVVTNVANLAAAVNASHAYAAAGQRTIQVYGTDEDGEFLLDQKAIVVGSGTIQGTVTGNDASAEGSAYTLNVSALTVPQGVTVSQMTVDWGDGTTSVVNNPNVAVASQFTKTYADGNANRAISVTVIANGAPQVVGGKALSVTNVAPSATVAGNASVAEGAAYQLTVSNKVDPGSDTLTSLRISWGDGTADTVVNNVANLAAAINASHVYADGNASRTIQVFGTDEDGEFLLGTRAVSVTNVAPTLDISGAGTGTAGTAYVLSLGAIVDPGQDTAQTVRINWGDGTFTVLSRAATAPFFPATVAKTYAASGTFAITADITDEDGTFSAVDTQSVQIGAVVGTTYNLTKQTDGVPGGNGDDIIVATDSTLTSGDTISGGGGANKLVASGKGRFDLRAPLTLTGITTFEVYEGLPAYREGSVPVANAQQIINLRDGLDLTVNVLQPANVPANLQANLGITIVGAKDASVINLNKGNATVTLGDIREAVYGGGGNNTYLATRTTIGATMDGGTGVSRLVLSEGGVAAMGANITRIASVTLSNAAGAVSQPAWDFTANAIAGLSVIGSNQADTIRLGAAAQSAAGGVGADIIYAGSGGSTISGDAGNDSLVAGVGADIFAYAPGFGNDTITGFQAKGANFDSLRIDQNVFSNFAHLLGATQQTGTGDLLITKSPTETILLKNVQMADFTAANVSFM